MSEAVIVAIISGLCVGVPSVIATLVSNKKNNELINYQIKELKTQVEKHNGVIERVYKLEQTSAVRDEEIKVVNHRINDLENKVG